MPILLLCSILILTLLYPHHNLDAVQSNLASIPVILMTLPRRTLEVLTGNMLGDGGIRYPNIARDGKASGNARYGMTMSSAAYDYLMTLFNEIYAQ